MTVNPASADKSLSPACSAKSAALRRMIDQTKRDVELEVDGGIDRRNDDAGGRGRRVSCVAGSAIFGTGEASRRRMNRLRTAAFSHLSVPEFP